jgi:putative membrane protein
MKRNQFLVIALACSLAGACNRDHANQAANAPNPDTGAVGTAGTADKNKPGLGDKDFVQDTAKAGTAEIELGRMAAEKAIDGQVKKFGQMMVDDHSPAADKLKAIATDTGIEWPAELDGKFKDKSDDLAKKQGIDFDHDYMAFMVDAHQDLVDKLESRIDKDTLSKWKTDMKDHPAGKTVEEKGKTVVIVPEKSDNAVTMRINEWAAAVYPTAYAHLEAAKTLDNAIKKRHTNP